MDCDICRRQPSGSLPFFCTTCARNALYETRLESAQVLLEKGDYKKKVEQALTLRSSDDLERQNSPNTFQKIAANKVHSRVLLEDARARGLHSKDQVEKISRDARKLQEQIKRLREAASARRNSNAERRIQLSAAQKTLAQEQATAPEPVKKATIKIQSQWNSLHGFDVDSRIFLCKEAANLLGLKQRKRKKAAPGRDVYTIAGIPIPDLRDLNTADPTIINVSTFRLAHLLHLVTSYLSLRLPAELHPPDPANPHPTLTFPQFSYPSKPPSQPTNPPFAPAKRGGPTAFLLPQHTPPPPKQTSPSPRSKPHTLHLPTKLAVFAHEDPAACSSFLDAIALLAWDIAWLCRMQGLDVGNKNWEEICAMGKNLYTLLLAPPTSILPNPGNKPSTPTPSAMTSTPQSSSPAAAAKPSTTTPAPNSSSSEQKTRMGHYSHDSNWAFLGSARGQEFQRGWKFAGPGRFVERLKRALANEREGAEWEVVGEGELEGWRDGDEGEEVGVHEGELGEEGNGGGMENGEALGKGNKGWTKVLSRGGEA